MKRKESAFTLLEMLLVLFIISLLLYLISPSLLKQRGIAENKTDGALIATIQTQVDLATDDTNSLKVTYETLLDQEYLSKKQVDHAQKRHIIIENNQVKKGKS